MTTFPATAAGNCPALDMTESLLNLMLAIGRDNTPESSLLSTLGTGFRMFTTHGSRLDVAFSELDDIDAGRVQAAIKSLLQYYQQQVTTLQNTMSKQPKNSSGWRANDALVKRTQIAMAQLHNLLRVLDARSI